MSLEIDAKIVDGKSALVRLDRLALTAAEKAEVHERIVARSSDLTRAYLTQMAASRHATAQKLGASPTGFWGEAAESVSGASDDAAARVSIASPGIGRVDHDVTIRPGPGKKYLTIPVHPSAYGKRARELAKQIPLFPLRTGPGRVGVLAAGKKEDKTVTAMYLLVPEVHQKQDRTLLPSDEVYLAAGIAGVRDWAEGELEK